MTSEKLQFFNKVLVRVTWFFLTIGLFDHFVAEFLPLPWPTRNLWLLFSLIGVLLVSETLAYFVRRRESRRPKPNPGSRPE